MSCPSRLHEIAPTERNVRELSEVIDSLDPGPLLVFLSATRQGLRGGRNVSVILDDGDCQ